MIRGVKTDWRDLAAAPFLLLVKFWLVALLVCASLLAATRLTLVITPVGLPATLVCFGLAYFLSALVLSALALGVALTGGSPR
jgi:hypothetical protein